MAFLRYRRNLAMEQYRAVVLRLRRKMENNRHCAPFQIFVDGLEPCVESRLMEGRRLKQFFGDSVTDTLWLELQDADGAGVFGIHDYINPAVDEQRHLRAMTQLRQGCGFLKKQPVCCKRMTVLHRHLRQAIDLPYTTEWFSVPPRAPHGQTPKLGTLHPSLVLAVQAAFRAATA